jgi:predicted nuclease with TOPRIM domain
MNDIKNDLNEIKTNLRELTEAVKSLEQQCSRMNNHINFIEETYSSLRTPLDFLLQKVNYITGSNVPVLPVLPVLLINNSDDSDDKSYK